MTTHEWRRVAAVNDDPDVGKVLLDPYDLLRVVLHGIGGKCQHVLYHRESHQESLVTLKMRANLPGSQRARPAAPFLAQPSDRSCRP